MERIEALKSYLFALSDDGVFKGCKTPSAIATRAAAAFAKDLTAVTRDLATVAIGNVRNAIADRLRSIGLDELHDIYMRGVDANARKGSKC